MCHFTERLISDRKQQATMAYKCTLYTHCARRVSHILIRPWKFIIVKLKEENMKWGILKAKSFAVHHVVLG